MSGLLTTNGDAGEAGPELCSSLLTSAADTINGLSVFLCLPRFLGAEQFLLEHRLCRETSWDLQ